MPCALELKHAVRIGVLAALYWPDYVLLIFSSMLSQNKIAEIETTHRHG